jgi:hypothetical protein
VCVFCLGERRLFKPGVALPISNFCPVKRKSRKAGAGNRRQAHGEKGTKVVDYIVVILALSMVGLYALLIHWLLPKA